MKEKKFKLNYIFKMLFAILVIIGIYVAFNFIKIFSKKSVQIYEVTIGEIVNVDRHKGIIYRDESVARCNTDGYINFYVANAERVKRGNFIYTINDKPSSFDSYELDADDVLYIKQNIKKYVNSINDLYFSNIYKYKNDIGNLIDEINVVKQLEKIDVEKELDANEKGYSQYAGLVSFEIDGFENEEIENFSDQLLKKYDVINVSSQKKEVDAGDKIYKIIKNPEYYIAFDSAYDYDNYDKSKVVKVKFVYEDVSINGRIESFIGNDGKKHFKIKTAEFPEKFLGKRVVEFEIENKKISGYKIPIKSIVSKNCYKIPKEMVTFNSDTNEYIFNKIAEFGTKNEFSCNVSKEDDKYYYVSIDDALSNLRYGDVLTNRYNDTYSLSEVVKLDGVYNMNRGFAIFKNVDVVDKTNEYVIVKKGTVNGISLYDHIALNANEVIEGDLIS